MSQVRDDHIDRWARYWNACVEFNSPANGVNFFEIQSADDVALARKFCRVLGPGGLLSGYTDQEIMSASDRLRAHIATLNASRVRS